MEYVSINKERIKYLLSLYKMTVDELLCVATKGLKKPSSRGRMFIRIRSH